MKELISIIVPVYNVDRYLERCVNSLINQSYKNLEIILVDDGSTDKSGIICDRYEKEYKNIKVVHKKNGGLSSARNVGIETAKGAYLGFVDSDDWVHPDMYFKLYGLLVSYHADVASASYVFSNNNTKIELDEKSPIYVFENEDIIEYYVKSSFEKTIGEYPVWSKLYKREIFEKVRFEEGKIYEDILPNFKIMSNINVFVKTMQPLYFYYKNEESITRNKLSSRDFYLLEICDNIINEAKALENVEVLKYAYLKKYRTYFSLLAKGVIYGYSEEIENPDLIVRELAEKLRKHEMSLLKSNIAISRKILILLICINPKIVTLMSKFIRRVVKK